MKYKPRGGKRNGDAQPLKEVIHELLDAYRRQQDTGKPVHTWQL